MIKEYISKSINATIKISLNKDTQVSLQSLLCLLETAPYDVSDWLDFDFFFFEDSCDLPDDFFFMLFFRFLLL